MNLCDLILLNFLAWIRISATINPQKVEVSNISGITENYIKLRNIFRVKRSGNSISLCSDKVKVKKNHDGVYCEKCQNKPTPWPCAINSKYEIRIKIAEGSYGSVFKGKNVIVDQDVAIKIEKAVTL